MSAARIDLSLLRVHAQVATPGPWRAWMHGEHPLHDDEPGVDTREGEYVCTTATDARVGGKMGDADAAFIAAADPAVVLALVETVEAALAVRDTDPANCPECGGNDQTGAHERWCNVELGDYDAACSRLDAALEPFTAEATDAA